MTTYYRTFADAKIANPASEIYESMSGDFANADHVSLVAMCGTGEGWNKCNPFDHCITVEKFLDDGHKFVKGDICIYPDGSAVTITNTTNWNDPFPDDNIRYVLRAAALEEPKPKRMKVEYVKVEDSIFGLQHDLVEGKLFYQDIDENYYPIETEIQLVHCFDSIFVYRKVETEIDERQEFIDAAIELIDASKKADGLLGAMFDSGKFKLVD